MIARDALYDGDDGNLSDDDVWANSDSEDDDMTADST
jgi:hypothetical protein